MELKDESDAVLQWSILVPRSLKLGLARKWSCQS